VTKSVRSKIKSLKESCGQYLEGKDDRISEDKVQEYGTVGFCSFLKTKRRTSFPAKRQNYLMERRQKI
jgi:hypothetical protein